MGQECGLVVASVNHPVEGRGPVSVKPVLRIHPNTGGDESEHARMEWDRHTKGIIHQPTEVMHHAWLIFQQVFQTQGCVSGVKARALVLVSLLYSGRLLHGSNRGNEEYLLKSLQTPTRVMNKAFTQMATVTLPKATTLG